VSDELPDDELRALAERGWFIRDGFLPHAEALQAHAFAAGLVETLRPAGVGPEGFLDPTIRGDFTGFIDDSPVRGAFEHLMAQLNASVGLELDNFQTQLGYYPGNGALYVKHIDALPKKNLRRVTALLYLNPDWKPEHGGHLRLHLDPELDVEPKLNRLVVFLSERIFHEVRPAFAPRLTLTAWFRTRSPA
jgi:SM-20-related protein